MSSDNNLHKDHLLLEGELRLILQRLEQLSKDQQSGFSEIKHRIRAIEEHQQELAVFQGKTEHRLDRIESEVHESNEHSSNATISKLALAAMACLSALIGVVGAIATKGF
jgi:hypothetical protein